MKQIIVPAEIVQQLIAECDSGTPPETPPGRWPENEAFAVLLDQPVWYGNQRLAGIMTTSDQEDGSRAVLMMLGDEQRETHRMFNYLPQTGEAGGAGGMTGPVSEAQMDADAVLTGKLLNLLLSDTGEMVAEPPGKEHSMLQHSDEPAVYWRVKQG